MAQTYKKDDLVNIINKMSESDTVCTICGRIFIDGKTLCTCDW